MVAVQPRGTLHEGLYLHRGKEHAKHQPELFPVPEESLPGMPQESEALEQAELEKAELHHC